MNWNYLETIYSQKKKPFTEYPKKLINYLCNRFDLKDNDKLLEIGCGRGDFLNEFKKKNLIYMELISQITARIFFLI